VPIPILFVGDSPSGHSGLGRILKDVALRTHQHLGDLFDVATLGIGAPPSPSLPFSQYPAAKVDEWVLHDLPWVWRAHAKGREGIIFGIWDVSRLLWMAYPEQCPDPEVQNFLLDFGGEKWIYPAVDGAGPNGKLPTILQDALAKFDRVLNYTDFSANITGYPDVCTHGIDTNVFYPRPDAREVIAAKFSVKLDPDEVLIGIVATNQPRKDWALAFSVLALLRESETGIKCRVWIHTDTDMRHWDLKAMYLDFGLHPDVRVFITPFGLPDDDLATLYSACDITLGIAPEGFGYAPAESLCCGAPCVVGSYGGQGGFTAKQGLHVDPTAFRYEGLFAILRPVYDAADFVECIVKVLRRPENFRRTPPVCAWDDVWPSWEKWLRAGL
jgi:glycosyltransferase involved in cell wall biosynthesis